MVRDKQKSKVYNWEKNVLKNSYLTDGVTPKIELHKYKDWALSRSKEFVNTIFREVQTPPHDVLFCKGIRAYWSTGKIFIPEDYTTYVTKEVLLHEIAHGILINQYGIHRFAQHGPEFMNVFINLLIKYLDYDKKDLIKTLKISSIEILESNMV